MPSPSAPRRLQAVSDAAEQTNEDLLVACAHGDETAFATLYDRLSGLTYGVIKKVLRDPAQSEEVTQEVVAEVWQSASRFDPDLGTAQTWLLTIAHRRAIDRVRSVQASRDRTQRVGQRDMVRSFDEVAEVIEIRFEHGEVRAALDELTYLQREAIELAYYCGYTYREVAQLLDTPLGTVKSRLRDGLTRLRDAMGVAMSG